NGLEETAEQLVDTGVHQRIIGNETCHDALLSCRRLVGTAGLRFRPKRAAPARCKWARRRSSSSPRRPGKRAILDTGQTGRASRSDRNRSLWRLPMMKLTDSQRDELAGRLSARRQTLRAEVQR